MSTRRVALIFDNSARPESTGFYCRRALGCLVDVEHFQPDEINDIPRSEFDLLLNVDDGLRYEFPDRLSPSACWIIDTHIDFNWSLQKARQFDFVFAAQKDGAEALRRSGIEGAQWLPLACDPELHRPHEVEKAFDVSFVGNLFPGERSELIGLIRSSFDRTFVGNAYRDEMARVYSASRAVFNRSVSNDINMRVYEALACGALLVTNDLSENGQDELFDSARHFVTYNNGNELLEKLRYFLAHPDELIQIAGCGRVHALGRHTYLHRMTELLRSVERRMQGRVEQPQASACLVSWKRPENVRQIVASLRDHSRIDDIVVWNNNPDVQLDIDGDDVVIVNSHGNMVTYGRFLATEHARHDIVYTQDDDCLVGNMDQLFETFDLDSSSIAHGLKLGHLLQNSGNLFGSGHMALLGWGAVFDRRWCRVLRRYIEAFGEDELLRRKADRIFTLLLERRHRSILAEVQDLSGASGPESLSVMADHQSLTAEAISRVMSIQQQQPSMDEGQNSGESLTGDQSSSKTNGKDAGYFEFVRPELLELVPESARKVLDVGCGAGRLGEAIRSRQGAEVWGIEREADVATRAQSRLDKVIAGDVERDLPELDGNQFDVIVCGDVIEHLRDPRRFLQRCRNWLSDDGRVIASIPNVRHHSVVAALLDGNWTYEAAGLLDDDHMRFFTRKEIEKLFFRAGFELERVGFVPGEGYAEWHAAGSPGEIDVGAFRLSGLSREEAEDFHAYQYLVIARKRLVTSNTKTSMTEFAAAFPWPERRPTVPIPKEETGWLADGARECLAAALDQSTGIVVELGAWLGMSTRFIADHAQNATVISIDHWQGSPEHQTKPQWSRMLPTLYETFLAMNWEYRDRVIPIRQTTQDGLRTVAASGIKPDLIFFDADHSEDAVTADVGLARELFPEAILVGDDYDDPGVSAAVTAFAEKNNADVTNGGETWRAWRIEPATPTADSAPVRDDGVTSIVIVTHNQLAYTHQCIASIRQFTDEPVELIVVDNGSTDGTVDYLRSLSNVQVISNAENSGFPEAANQGIEASTGSQILLLNNDTIVTTGWLRRMLDALQSDDSIGLVGPCSNAVSGEQQVPVTYERLSCLDGFAWDWGNRHRGQLEETDRLVGFCLLIRREVVDQVGLLDEQFGIGCFEDDDYCRRTAQAGFRAVIARDAFVHHFGSVTFRASGTDFSEVMRVNQEKFNKKWHDKSGGTSQPKAAPPSHAGSQTVSENRPNPVDSLAPLAVTLSADGGLLLTEQSVHLSLCMIVRDNESTIRPCLESIRPWVDEMIIVDTGSNDSTPDICRELGARMFEFPWIDDFSAARNESLKYATGNWIFWMDSDDTIPEHCGRGLRELADGDHAQDTLGYVMQVHCPGDNEFDMTVVDHVKLFRNHHGLQFEGRIHEQIIPAIRRTGGNVEFSEWFVVHSGSERSEEGRKRKLERDFRILHRELEDQPEHPFVLFNLGMTYADAERHEEAIGFLRKCIEVSQPEESHLRKAYALLISSCSRVGDTREAESICDTALRLYADDKELLFRRALLLHELGQFEAAIDTYLRVIDDPEDRHFTSVDQGISGYKARHNLAVVYDELGRADDAIEQWGRVLAEASGYPPAVKALGDLLIRSSRLEQLQSLIDEYQNAGRASSLSSFLAARLAESQGDSTQAISLIDSGRTRHPQDDDLLQEQARLLFEHRGPGYAVEALRELVERASDDAAAWHNLGTAAFECEEWTEAETAYRTSVGFRPESAATWLQLGFSLQFAGQNANAIEVWDQGLENCPGDQLLMDALKKYS